MAESTYVPRFKARYRDELAAALKEASANPVALLRFKESSLRLRTGLVGLCLHVAHEIIEAGGHPLAFPGHSMGYNP